MDLDLSLESNKVREGMESKSLCTHSSGGWLEDEEIVRLRLPFRLACCSWVAGLTEAELLLFFFLWIVWFIM